MHLATFTHDGKTTAGAVVDTYVFDLGALGLSRYSRKLAVRGDLLPNMGQRSIRNIGRLPLTALGTGVRCRPRWTITPRTALIDLRCCSWWYEIGVK